MISSRKYSKKEIKRLMLCDTGSRWEPGSGAWAPVRGGARPPVLSFFITERSGKLTITGKKKTETSCPKEEDLETLKAASGFHKTSFCTGLSEPGGLGGGLKFIPFPVLFRKKYRLTKHLGVLKYDNYKVEQAH